MGNTLDSLYKKQSLIYKYFLYVVSIGCIVFFFPKGGKFKYEFQKGKPWQYANLYAPFDFSIKKTAEEIARERREAEQRQIAYYNYDETIAQEVYSAFNQHFPTVFPSDRYSPGQIRTLASAGNEILDEIYENGILQKSESLVGKNTLYLIKDNEARRINQEALFRLKDLDNFLAESLGRRRLRNYRTAYNQLFFDIIKPNVTYDEVLSKKELEDELSKISVTRGNVDEGKLIVAKGEVVEADNLLILNSLKAEYESELWTESNYYFIIFGYTILVALVLMMLLLFLKKYRQSIYRNNVKVTFIFFNILNMVFITTMVVKYNPVYVYVVPLCILPLILKTFFDARLGLFVHVLTVLILGFVV
ncbi:MAG TPA: hypothetical protein VKN36_07505, partial [Eudoraea sp.]|nr:hypothetical protein [Eudoraea sp.]